MRRNQIYSKFLWFTLIVLIGIGSAAAAPGDLDSSFNPGTIAGGTSLFTAVVQADGKIIIGGSFTTIGTATVNRLARLNPNGSLDTTFNTGTGPDSTVRKIYQLPDGKFLIVGDFVNYNGVVRNRVARLNADGSLDTTLDTSSVIFTVASGSAAVLSAAVQTDGKIIVGGFFTMVNGGSYTNIARLNANGTLDTSFNPVLSPNSALGIVVTTIGDKIYVGGGFTTFNGEARNRFARLNADGTLDSAYPIFNGANNQVNSILPTPNGKILVGGFFTAFSGETHNGVARLNADGSIDSSFITPAFTITSVYIARAQNDGKVLIGGNFTGINNVPRGKVARLNADGSLDLTFNPGTGTTTSATTYVMEQLADGKILVGGLFTTYNGIARTRLIKVLNTGAVNADFTGDTKTDLSVFRGGTWYLQNGGGFQAQTFGVNGDQIAPGDYDGDNKIDLAVFRPNADPSQADFYILGSATNTIFYVSWGTTGDVPVVGDYTGDGKDDVAVYRPSNSFWYILPNGGGSPLVLKFGVAEDIPLVGDYDGDGAANLAVYRPSTGFWYYSRDLVSPGTNFVSQPFGLSGDKPVPADYDGDGKTDLAVFRPSDQTWYINQSGLGTVRYEKFGLATDKLVPGDYDGDNHDDVAVYRDGTWYIMQSLTSQVAYAYFGNSTDNPVPNAYIR